MNTNYSVTGIGMITFALLAVFKYFNIGGISEADLSAALTNLMQFVSFCVMVWGQVRRKDLVMGVFRK